MPDKPKIEHQEIRIEDIKFKALGLWITTDGKTQTVGFTGETQQDIMRQLFEYVDRKDTISVTLYLPEVTLGGGRSGDPDFYKDRIINSVAGKS